MISRAGVAPVVLTALLLVATASGSSPAARHDPEPPSLDLLTSAHPTSSQPTVSDVAFDNVRARGAAIEADAAALTSTTCDGCAGESSTLQVVYVPRAGEARVDNVANAWAQECRGCTSTALSVQVVVLRGRPVAVPNNRALSLTAACTSCRTSALAFQVVLVSDRATALTGSAVAELQAWFDEQVAVLRASVAPPPSEAVPEAQATPEATPSPTTPTDGTTSSDPLPTEPRTARRVRRDAVSALGELEQLLVSDLGAQTLSADIEVSR